GSSAMCVDGACAPACLDPRTTCATGASAVCVDLTSSSGNCGSCGHRCGSGMTCSASECRCPIGREMCGDACVDTRTDEASCGTCGHACGAGEECTAGVCTPCEPGRALCGGSCLDVQSDPRNCGSCGNV